MFVDERLLTARSGDGGDGIVAWRRERRVPRGGPAGGDGGDGGSVILIADTQLTTFGDMEDVRVVRAEHGDRGGGNNRTGKNGKDRVLLVPVGTTVYDETLGHRLVDLGEPGQRWYAARGGHGGRGNSRFATAVEQRPMRCLPAALPCFRHNSTWLWNVAAGCSDICAQLCRPVASETHGENWRAVRLSQRNMGGRASTQTPS